MTPPALSEHGLDWVVVRVMIPGLQPMHGVLDTQVLEVRQRRLAEYAVQASRQA